MTHPMTQLQGALVASLAADNALVAMIGANAVFDAPPKGRRTPYVAIARHEMRPRDGDSAPGHDHRVTLNIWHHAPSRARVLEIADRIAAVTIPASLTSALLRITFARIEKTDTSVDLKSGAPRAVVSLRVFSEPNN